MPRLDDRLLQRVRNSGHQPTPIPILPMLAAIFITLALVQVGYWAWQASHPSSPATKTDASAKLTGNPFTDMAFTHPRSGQAVAINKLRKVVIPALPTNLQFGDPNANTVVTILSDPSCGDCRTLARSWLHQLPQDVRLVYKFWPKDPDRLTPGMLLELARRSGVASAFWRKIEDQKADINDEELLALLDASGVPLDAQRAALTDTEAPLMKVLEADIAKARSLQLPPPPVLVVDGYLLEGGALQPENIAPTVAKLRSRNPLARGDDFFLMEK